MTILELMKGNHCTVMHLISSARLQIQHNITITSKYLSHSDI